MNFEFVNKTKKNIPEKDLAFLLMAFGKKYHLNFSSLALVFVGEKRSRSLNLAYRGIDRATDILSFSPAGFPGSSLEKSAELVLCPALIFRYRNYLEVFPDYSELFSRQSREKKKNYLRKYLLYFVVIHGLLHLAGYDDIRESERLQMVRLGQEFLADHGFLIGQ